MVENEVVCCVTLGWSSSFGEILSTKHVQNSITYIILVRMPGAGLERLQEMKACLDRLGLKVFPGSILLVFVHSDPSTGNVNLLKGSHVVGMMLEHRFFAELDEETSEQHRFMIQSTLGNEWTTSAAKSEVPYSGIQNRKQIQWTKAPPVTAGSAKEVD